MTADRGFVCIKQHGAVYLHNHQTYGTREGGITKEQSSNEEQSVLAHEEAATGGREKQRVKQRWNNKHLQSGMSSCLPPLMGHWGHPHGPRSGLKSSCLQDGWSP